MENYSDYNPAAFFTINFLFLFSFVISYRKNVLQISYNWLSSHISAIHSELDVFYLTSDEVEILLFLFNIKKKNLDNFISF